MAPLKRFLVEATRREGRDGLVFQRLFWGAIAGCIAAIFLAESPLLETLELGMLRWRYKVSTHLAPLARTQSRDICIVAFDDSSQFDLGIARFNDQRSQAVLVQALSVIEAGRPALIGLDLDLRGAANPDLIRLFRRHRNVVMALFGSLEGSTDLPAAEFMTHAAAYGYSELIRESDQTVCRLPVNYQGKSMSADESAFSPVPSLTEAIIDVHRKVKGVGPSTEFMSFNPEQPVYINFRGLRYPTISFQELLSPDFDPRVFRDRVVLVGSTMTGRRDDPLKCRTPLSDEVPELEVQAEAVSTLLDNKLIYSFSRDIAWHILFCLGAFSGALASLLPMGQRTMLVLSSGLALLILAQVAFTGFQLSIPVVPPLAVLFAVYVLGTVIYLDTDLRQRNKELAAARESMQVRAEEERQRIAEDLHDETLPALSAVARMADKLSGELPDNAVPRTMREKLDAAVSEMRRVINDLHPSVLETMGFVPALENLVNILSRDTGIESNFVDGTGSIDRELTRFKKLQLYRIVQEALNNIEKHSEATMVEVFVERDNDTLMISVADNGRGIAAGAIRKDSHGLLNIRQRAQLIGASVDWVRPLRFATGTEVRLRIILEDDTADRER